MVPGSHSSNVAFAVRNADGDFYFPFSIHVVTEGEFMAIPTYERALKRPETQMGPLIFFKRSG